MMPAEEKYKPLPGLFMLGALVTGIICAQILPSEWFLNVLIATFFVCGALGAVIFFCMKKEPQPNLPVALVLTVLGLPTSNGEMKDGFLTSLLLWVFGFDAGLTVGVVLLVHFNP